MNEKVQNPCCETCKAPMRWEGYPICPACHLELMALSIRRELI